MRLAGAIVLVWLAGAVATWKVFGPEVCRPPVGSAKAYKITNTGMEPAVMDGERVAAIKYKERGLEPKRFDIVFYRAPDGLIHFSRILGLPGEEVEIKDGRALVGGAPISPGIKYYNFGKFAQPGQKVLTPKDAYFLLGDNGGQTPDGKWHSADSRAYGPIPKDKLIAKGVRVYWPPSAIRDLEAGVR